MEPCKDNVVLLEELEYLVLTTRCPQSTFTNVHHGDTSVQL